MRPVLPPITCPAGRREPRRRRRRCRCATLSVHRCSGSVTQPDTPSSETAAMLDTKIRDFFMGQSPSSLSARRRPSRTPTPFASASHRRLASDNRPNGSTFRGAIVRRKSSLRSLDRIGWQRRAYCASDSGVTPFPWPDLLIIAGLIVLNGVFAMSELAIVSARTANLEAAEAQGSKGARVALTLAADPGKFLSTVQIGITLVAIIAGAYSGSALGGPVGERLAALGVPAEFARRCGFRARHCADHLFQPRHRRTGAQAGGLARCGADRAGHGAADGAARPHRRAAGLAARQFLRPADAPDGGAARRAIERDGRRTADDLRRCDAHRRDRGGAAPDPGRRRAAGGTPGARSDDPAHRTRLDRHRRRRCRNSPRDRGQPAFAAAGGAWQSRHDSGRGQGARSAGRDGGRASASICAR